jgi:uncharacterized protein YjbI with pentapeptide repeats
MANQEHLELLLQGVDGWNAWRRRNPTVKPDLSGARLINVDLERAVLDGADLRQADLSKAQLSHASLARANLESATLILADLLGASLNESCLAGASFFGAFLFGTRLKSADLKGANLLGSSLMGADLSNADLTGAHLMSANFHEANLTGANLSQADMTAASLIGTRLEGARIDSCWVHGLSAWRLEGRPAAQSRLIITPRKEPPIWVDDLEAAQLVSLLVYATNPAVRASVCIASRMVLVLGRFKGAQQDAARAIAESVSKQQLLPIVSELDPAAPSDNLKPLESLLQSARSVVLDLSGIRQGKKVLDALVKVCPEVRVLIVSQSAPSESMVEPAGSGKIIGVEGYRETSELESILNRHLGF